MGFLDGMIGIKIVRADSGDPVTQRDTIHFVGERFQVADDPAAGEVVLTMLAAESAPPVTISPPTITDDVELYAPTGVDTATLIRLSISDDVAIHGLTAPSLVGDPRKTLALTAGGVYRLEIPHMSSETSATARFVCPFGVSYYLLPFGSIDVLYDSEAEVWRLIP